MAFTAFEASHGGWDWPSVGNVTEIGLVENSLHRMGWIEAAKINAHAQKRLRLHQIVVKNLSSHVLCANDGSAFDRVGQRLA